jgi:hypothetical protein
MGLEVRGWRLEGEGWDSRLRLELLVLSLGGWRRL